MQPSGSEARAAREGRPTPSVRLLARLRAMGLTIPEGYCIGRTYAGAVQRRDGAWSWSTQPPRGDDGIGVPDVGSQFPVGTLLSAERLIAVHRHGDWSGAWHVLPWDGDPAKPGEILEPAPCAGSGRPWGSGTGNPICRVCYRGPGSLGVNRPPRRGQWWAGKVPRHEPRTR